MRIIAFPQVARAAEKRATGPQIGELLERYRADLLAEGRRQQGICAYMIQLKRCINRLEVVSPSDLSTAVIADDLAALALRGWAPATRSQYLSALRNFCRWCVAHQMLAADPTAALRHPRRPNAAPKALSSAQLAIVWRAIAVPDALHGRTRWTFLRNRRVCLLMLYAGLRRMEAAQLRWRDVDLAGGSLMVRDGKGGKDRAIPLHPTLATELRQVEERPGWAAVAGRRDGRPMAIDSINHIFDRWLAALLPDDLRFSAHVLRHTFATELLRHKANLREIQELMGHEDLETTGRYLRVDAEQLRGAIEVLPDGWGLDPART